MTVPYVTAAIETSDPFIDYETNGLEVYVGDLANATTNLTFFQRVPREICWCDQPVLPANSPPGKASTAYRSESRLV